MTQSRDAACEIEREAATIEPAGIVAKSNAPAGAMPANTGRGPELIDAAEGPSSVMGGGSRHERKRPVGDVVTSDAFQRAVRDPLVVRVVKAVDGTIKNVRRVAPPGAPSHPVDDAGE